MKGFLAHEFAQKFVFSGSQPRVLISREAYLDTAILVDEVETEVGWLGLVSRQGNDFLIEKIFLLKQEVSSVTTELDAGAIAELTAMVIADGGIEAANKLRFWGHSHVNMGTTPSGQDEAQMAVFQDSCEWFVRGIFNKGGRAEISLFLWDIGIRIDDVPWEIYDAADERRVTAIRAEIAAKVKTKAYAYHSAQYGGYYSGYQAVEPATTAPTPTHIGKKKDTTPLSEWWVKE